MSLFGCLTLKNIHQIRNRRISVLSSSGVLSRMARIYDLLVSILIQTIHKDEYRCAQEYLFLQISHLIFYFNYISMFYVNYLSSLIFRQLSKQVLIHFFKKQEDISIDITMINHQENNKQLENRSLKPFTIQPIVSISCV
ncbi:unnamed protein product [Rotaria sordida]|uniref:Transmembrane protein n=1 Tax=Rotaria sordida TaxID=392033 RepID=A0A814FKC3_9BILA|nr:unnamed protein product [Rotaria sordida]CAF1060925.1 unnamed protein product [Rotaria sordida]